MSDRFRILVVCTANVCRSPMIERMLRHRLREQLGDAAGRFEVASAGTWGHDEPGMHELSAAILADQGIDAADFTPRELVAGMVDDADLVLTAEREHRATVVSLCPRASRRTFTLREFARLLAPVDPVSIAGTDPVERARELVAEAAANRGLVPVERPDDDDLADPIGRHVNYFRETATLVGAALDAFLSRL